MASVAAGDRTATRDEVIAVRQDLRAMAARHELTNPRVDDIGTIMVESAQPGYGDVRRFAVEASAVVGVWVNVITDDVPAAQGTAEAL